MANDYGPYSNSDLPIEAPPKEVLRCDWCAWARYNTLGIEAACSGPPAALRTCDSKAISAASRAKLNATGDCVYYRTSWRTQVIRLFGGRRPHMIRGALPPYLDK